MPKEVTLNQTSSTSKKFGITTQSSSTKAKKYNYPLQKSPPLSIQQFIRSSVGMVNGTKQWVPVGKYHPEPFRAYLSPSLQEKEKVSPPVWKAIGPYREKAPTSLSPQVRPSEKINAPVWNPPGKVTHQPVPYFDPPSLRWSLQDLRRSVPDSGPPTMNSARNSSKSIRSIQSGLYSITNNE